MNGAGKGWPKSLNNQEHLGLKKYFRFDCVYLKSFQRSVCVIMLNSSVDALQRENPSWNGKFEQRPILS